jgi:nicotinamide-nucleotide adenylyltransferase
MPETNHSGERKQGGALYPTGVVHGRFQILHNDHLKYLLAGKARCEHLIVGITNPDPSLTREDSTDPGRSAAKANPLTYFERYTMAGAALVESGLSREDFSIVPFPINVPDLYRYYMPADAVYFITIYDHWGERKLELLQSRGLNVDVLWCRTPETKGITGSEIRSRMIDGRPWEQFVPKSTAALVRAWGVAERIRQMHGR